MSELKRILIKALYGKLIEVNLAQSRKKLSIFETGLPNFREFVVIFGTSHLQQIEQGFGVYSQAN